MEEKEVPVFRLVILNPIKNTSFDVFFCFKTFNKLHHVHLSCKKLTQQKFYY